MRPVNLLPARYRARTAGADSKTSYIALGVLGVLVLAIFAYVMTANSVSSKNSEIAQARQQIAAAQAQAVTFKDFGDFAAVKERRLTAVQSLATARLDWERLFRELAHVLPSGVWLTSFSGTAPGADSGSGGGGAAAETANSILLQGCADSHRQIADVIVRLRELHIAEDVDLTKTAASEDDAGGAAPPVAPGAPAATAGGEEGCGSYYSFDIAITIKAPAPAAADDATQPVPARLGGGS